MERRGSVSLIATLQIDLPRRRPDPEASGAARRPCKKGPIPGLANPDEFTGRDRLRAIRASHLARRSCAMTRARCTRLQVVWRDIARALRASFCSPAPASRGNWLGTPRVPKIPRQLCRTPLKISQWIFSAARPRIALKSRPARVHHTSDTWQGSTRFFSRGLIRTSPARLGKWTF